MKKFLLSIAVTMLVTQVFASYYYGKNDESYWKKTHPSYKSFEKAVEKQDWAKAAKLARAFDTTNDAWGYQKDYFNVFDRAGDYATALRFFERVLYIESVEDRLKKEQVSHIQDAARYAQQHELTSQYAILNALARAAAGDPDVAFSKLQTIADDDFGANLRDDLLKEIAVKAFDKSVARENWPAAAALATYILDTRPYWEAKTDALGLAFEKAGDIDMAYDCFEKDVESGRYLSMDRKGAAEKAAAFMLRNGLTSASWRTQSIVFLNSGKKAEALALLDKTWRENKEKDPYTYADTLKELQLLIPRVFDEAYAQKDWNLAVAAATYADWLKRSPSPLFFERIVEACENSGNYKAAAEFCLGIPNGEFEQGERIFDQQGNPELIKRAAVIAKEHNVDLADRNANAWLAYLKGDTTNALNILKTVVNEYNQSTKTFETTVAVSAAEILSGDIYLDQGNLAEALAHYKKGTYILSYYCSDKPKNFWGRTYFYEALGISCQSYVLCLLNQPDRAQAELNGLVSWRSDIQKSVIYPNITLDEAWSKAVKGIATAREANSRSTASGGLSSSDDSYYTLRQICQLESEAEDRARSAKIQADLEERMSRPYEPSRFMQSWIAAQKEAESPAVSDTSSSSSRSRSFDVKGGLDAQNKKSSARRCSFCLGSGKAGYVTGAKYENTRTGQEEFPACSHCNGTGWR